MNKKLKQKSLKRLNIIKGQIDGLKKMIEKDSYCVDVLIQSTAIQKALEGLDLCLLENHLGSCFKKAIKDKAKGRKAIKEVIQVFKQARK